MNDMANRNAEQLLEEERAILEVTELVCRLMNEQRVSRSELADRIGLHKSRISQLLNGSANMTVRTLSGMLFAMGTSLRVSAVPLGSQEWDCEEQEDIPSFGSLVFKPSVQETENAWTNFSFPQLKRAG